MASTSEPGPTPLALEIAHFVHQRIEFDISNHNNHSTIKILSPFLLCLNQITMLLLRRIMFIMVTLNLNNSTNLGSSQPTLSQIPILHWDTTVSITLFLLVE